MNFLYLIHLSILWISLNTPDTTKIPAGFWVTENFEVIKIDTIEKYLDLISSATGNESSSLSTFRFNDTLSFQESYYERNLNGIIIVNRFDFLILHNTNDSLVLKPISELAIKLMGSDQVLIFTRYGSGLNMERFHFQEFELINEKIYLRINSSREIFLTIKDGNYGSLREQMEMDRSKQGIFTGSLSEIEYLEFQKILAGTGFAKGNNLNNDVACSHCLHSTMIVRYNEQTNNFHYSMGKPILYPLNKLILSLKKHDSLRRVGQ